MVIELPSAAKAVVARDMTMITARTIARILLVVFIVFVPFFF
jgi:hypothetical protein